MVVSIPSSMFSVLASLPRLKVALAHLSREMIRVLELCRKEEVRGNPLGRYRCLFLFHEMILIPCYG